MASVPQNPSQPVSAPTDEAGRAFTSNTDCFHAAAQWNADIAHLAPEVRARLMAKYSITYNGRHYESGGYRYDLLADSVRYAKLQRVRGGRPPEARSTPENVEAPNEEQRLLMIKLGITFQDGIYRFEAFRYERLSDATNYALLKWRLPVER